MQKAPAVWDALPQCGAVVLTTDRDCFKSSDSFLFLFFFKYSLIPLRIRFHYVVRLEEMHNLD